MTDLLRATVYCDEVGRTSWGECAGCRAELPRRKDGGVSRSRVWCSQECVDRWSQDHTWPMARHEAMRRAPRITIERQGWDGPYEVEVAACVRCRAAQADEVDHIVPRNGAGYRSGCHHHQANLQPLCGPCHVAKGVVYRAVRRALEQAGRIALPTGWVPPAAPPETLPLSLWGDA